MAPSARRRRLRWLAPFATAAVVALLAAAPGLSAASTPALPAITAGQLLAKVEQANVSALSGTIDLNTNLGIPNLSELNDAAGDGGSQSATAFSPIDLLSGSHQALVWFDGPTKSRIDLLEDMAETDLIHNGANVWLWDSTTKAVTHQTLAPHTEQTTKGTAAPQSPMKTPQQVASDFLAKITPSTAVSVASNVSVAGRPAYQLVLSPHAATSTIDRVAIAIDSATGLPLRVEVFSKAQKSAVLTLGFGSIHFSTPAASEFAFTPPAGSKVTTGTIGGTVVPGSGPRVRRFNGHRFGRKMPNGAAPIPVIPKSTTAKQTETTVGQNWTSVAIVTHAQIPPQLQQYLNGGTKVTGTFGTGRIIGSSLVNILVLSDGRIAVGAVTPAALEAAVAAP